MYENHNVSKRKNKITVNLPLKTGDTNNRETDTEE